MKNTMLLALGAITLAATAQSAAAQSFDGFKVGATINRQVDKVEQVMPGTAGRFDRQDDSLGYRGFVGYDAVVGQRFLVGGELGLGWGGDSLRQAVGASGLATVNPGLTWDASVRAGGLVTDRVLIYGRVGYAHSELDRTLKTTPTAAKVSFGQSEGGLQYGLGAEAAVSKHLNLRGEFVRTDFAKHIRRDELRLGVAYRF